jgi:hypothetical protein
VRPADRWEDAGSSEIVATDTRGGLREGIIPSTKEFPFVGNLTDWRPWIAIKDLCYSSVNQFVWPLTIEIYCVIIFWVLTQFPDSSEDRRIWNCKPTKSLDEMVMNFCGHFALGVKSEDEILLTHFGTDVLYILNDARASKWRINSFWVRARKISKSTMILHFPEFSTIMVKAYPEWSDPLMLTRLLDTLYMSNSHSYWIWILEFLNFILSRWVFIVRHHFDG